MNTRKALLITGVTGIIGLASLGGVAAAANNDSGEGGTLVDKIATRFNLDKKEVQEVFDEDRKTHEAEHQQKVDDRLTKAVEEGKITAAQKEALLAKHAEIRTYMESLKDKSNQERNELMKQKMNEVRQWAEDNGLTEYMRMARAGHQFKMHSGDENSVRLP